MKPRRYPTVCILCGAIPPFVSYMDANDGSDVEVRLDAERHGSARRNPKRTVVTMFSVA
jgi:hypothetical protein